MSNAKGNFELRLGIRPWHSTFIACRNDPSRASASRSATSCRELLAREVHDPGHRLRHADARQGHAGPAARARLLHVARRREGAARDGNARSSARLPFLRRQIGQPAPAAARARARSSSTTSRVEQQRPHRADPPGARRPSGRERAGREADARPETHDDRDDDDRPAEKRPTIVDRDLRRDSRAPALPADLARPARRRLHRVAARDGLRARGARQGGAPRQRRPGARALPASSPASIASRSRRASSDADADALIVMECRRPDAHRRRRPRAAASSSTSTITWATRCTARSTGSTSRPRRAARWCST